MKKPLVIHPFLFGVFPILSLFVHNITMIIMPLDQIAIPLTITILFVLVLFSLLSFILKDKEKAGLVVSLFVLLFFSYGHFYNVMGNLHSGTRGFSFVCHKVFFPLWSFLFLLGAYFIIRTRRGLHNLTHILNVVASCLVLISLIYIGIGEFKTRPTLKNYNRTKKDRETQIIDLGNVATLRDIYYIILDSYASSATLKEIYDYDNHKFTDYLVRKGFYIASESRSNYPYTYLSLASSLNMEYINYLTDVLGKESKDWRVLLRMIKDAKVINLLKSAGYKFISLGWHSRVERDNQYANLDIECHKWWWNGFLFIAALIPTTALCPFQGYFIEAARKYILCNFYKLANAHRIKGPKFIFTYIFPPHPPCFFGANGEPVSGASLQYNNYLWLEKGKYLNQLIFVNKKIKICIDEILSKSAIPPIIILQADHGPASTFFQRPSRSSEEGLKEKMRIFNAYYLPSGGNELLYKSITPVNTFRLILNFYFNTNYELLNDQSYFSEFTFPYRFLNVTDNVKYE